MNTSLCVCVFCVLRAAPAAYGGSQARGPVRAAATGYTRVTTTWDPSCICNLHPQLTAMSDPQPTEQGQGSNLQPHGS